jgi:O-antigen/teichoic acid export membrane protein
MPTTKTARRTFTYAHYSVPSSFVSRFYQSADPLLIQLFSGAGGVGYYTLASQLAQPGILFSSSISSVLSVKSSGVDSVGGDVRQDLVNSAAYSGLIAVPILFGALAMSNALMQSWLFGSTFGDAPGAVLIGLALIQVANAYQKPLSSAIGGVDRPDIIFRVNVLMTLVYVPTSLILGQTYGLLGVVAGTVVAEGVALVGYQFVASRLFGGFVLPKPVGHQFLAGGVMFVAVEALSRVTDTARLTTLGLLIGIGAFVYFSTLLLVSEHFRETIGRTLGEFN